MNKQQEQIPGWLRGIVVLVVATVALAWWRDHQQQQERLMPRRLEVELKREMVDRLREQLIQANTFDGYDDWEEITWGIDNVSTYRIFEPQAASFTRVEDQVYHDAVPRLITMLDDPEPLRRQRAWRLLQCAQESSRFAAYEEEYRTGVIALLHHPAVRAYNKFLPWLVEQKMNTPEVLAGLRERMMDDDDSYAPRAAYTLAELDPTVDIAPRLLELIERKHTRWEAILHRLPNYMLQEEATRILQEHKNRL